MRKKKRNNFFSNAVIQHINQNSKLYILLIILFFIGLSIGIIFINNTNEENQNQISSYINSFVDTIKTEDKINLSNLICSSIKNDAIIIALLCFLGSTVVGMPIIYLIILYKGYSLGYTVASIFAALGRY